MKSSLLTSTLLILAVNLAYSQSIYYQTFGTGVAFPTGWSSTDGRIKLNTVTPSSGYHSSATSPEASGGNNVSFEQCEPSGSSSIYLICGGVINTTGKSNIRVGMGITRNSSFNEIVKFQYSTDSISWNIISPNISTNATTAWASYYFDLPADAGGVANLRFRIGFTPNATSSCSGNKLFQIDDFVVGEKSSLPVTLVRFTATPGPSSVTLQWATSNEANSDQFILERSADGMHFEALSSIPAAGTSSVEKEYAYTDLQPLPGKNYYRLRQIDFDGSTTFSPVVAASIRKSGLMTLAPTPATESIQIQLEQPAATDGTYQIFDLNGRLLQSGDIQAETRGKALNISTLPEGAYALRLLIGQDAMVEQFRKTK